MQGIVKGEPEGHQNGLGVWGGGREVSHQPPFEQNYRAPLIPAASLLGTEVCWIVCVSIEIWDDCATHVDALSVPPVGVLLDARSFFIILFQFVLVHSLCRLMTFIKVTWFGLQTSIQNGF